jgi:LacI family transcriptional regulator
MRHVALLIGTSGSFGRGLLRGVAKYNRENGGWSTYFHPQGIMETLPPWFKNWKGDGILALIMNAEMTRTLRKMKIPVVNLRLTDHPTPFPYVGLNHTKIAQMAAGHLLSLGLKHFGFCGRPARINPGLDERSRAFQEAIAAAGKTCIVYSHPMLKKGDKEQGWEAEQSHLADWITSLPKPVGIMTSNDERGLHVLDACRRCGASVPDEVAVIGVDNDEHLCDLSIPPLTSVDVNAEQSGYEAAHLLEDMMSGNKTPPPLTEFEPRGVVTRRSTDVIASEDAEVNRAVAFIRANSGRAIGVIDVLAHLRMSRASLQERMKRVLGHTIHEEIERVRLARVKELLLNSDMTIKQVTGATGFSSVQYMTRVFHSAVGETPARFRKHRGV